MFLKYLPFFYFFIFLTLLNPLMFMDAEFIIFLSLSFVALLAFINLNDLISKIYTTKLIEFRYNYLRNYNSQLWYIFSLTEFLNLRLFIYVLPVFLNWFTYYNEQINSFFSLNMQNIFTKILKLNLYFSYIFLKNLKLDVFSFYVLYFSFFKFKVECLFKKRRLANYRLTTFYLLTNKKAYLKSFNNNFKLAKTNKRKFFK